MPTKRLSVYFTEDELQQKKMNPLRWAVPGESRMRYERLARLTLDPIREDAGSPIMVNSGERSVALGRKKTKPNSRHYPPGERDEKPLFPDAAADIVSNRFTPRELAARILRLMEAKKIPKGGIGVYPTFVHVDNRGFLTIWIEDGKGPLHA